MYDTVRMEILQKDVSFPLVKTIPNYLTNLSEHHWDTEYYYLSGYLGKLQVNISEDKLKIPKGNLTSYFFDNPFSTLRRGSTEEVIMKLSDELHLNMQDARVSRIDIGDTFKMDFDESIYYKYLGDCTYHNRQEMDNGIYYKGANKTMTLYGKDKQLKNQRKTIPDQYKGGHYLRYELRLLKKLNSIYHSNNILASDLYDEEFYMKSIDIWKEHYFKINKYSKPMAQIPVTTSTKELMYSLANLSLSEHGYLNCKQTIREWQIKGLINKKQASDLRKKIDSISDYSLKLSPNDLTEELDNKIIESTKNYR